MNQAVERSTGLSAVELAGVLEQLPSGVVVVDTAGRPVLMNQAARHQFRARNPRSVSLIELSVNAGMSDTNGRRLAAEEIPLARILAGETLANEDYSVERGQGRPPQWLRISGQPLRDAQGDLIGAVTVFSDVTDERQQASRLGRLFEAEQHARAQAEEANTQLEQQLAERRRAEQALQASEHRLRLALEASRMGTFDYDVVQDRIEWSDEIAGLVGVPHASLTGSLHEGLKYLHPDDQPNVERAIREALEGGADLQIETRVVSPSNRVQWIMVKGRVYRDERGRPLRIIGIAMDVTDRKEAEAARQSLARGERLRALGEMASGIAHDLAQSLALITGYSDMMRSELQLDVPDVPRLREMVDITGRAASEGGQALRGLLGFVRTQELMAETERVDVAEILRDAARLTAPRWRDATQAEGRPISLHVEAEAGCIVQGSPAALREAITNLVFNAVDALPTGGGIQLSARKDASQVIVEVTDTGTGMPPEVRARIFDPFFTTKGERGTGLGLPQVVAIVERHGGKIDVDSTPGRGTTFRLTFPLGTSEPVTAPGELPEKTVAAVQRSIRILVVEDEQQLARMAGLVLTQRGHHVVVAASGEEAVARLEHESFDLVISDLGLGAGKNGWDVAEEVRQRWPGTRFVLVTGWGAAIDPEEARRRGVDEVIAKPYRIADLRQIADRIAAEGEQE